MFGHLRGLRSIIMGCLDSALNRMAGTTSFRDIWSPDKLAGRKRQLDPAFLDEMRWYSLTDDELANVTRFAEKYAQKINKRYSCLMNAAWEELDRQHSRRRSPITRTADEVDDLFRSQSWRNVSPWREELAHQSGSAPEAKTETDGPTPREPAMATSGTVSAMIPPRFNAASPESVPDGQSGRPTVSTALPDLVTLDQAAAIVNRSPAALRHYRNLGMPKPFVQGTKGKPNEYRWDEMRPWLEDVFGRPVPELSIRQFRASRR